MDGYVEANPEMVLPSPDFCIYAGDILMTDNEFLFIGLGNPGPKYSDTRHNVGFLVVDELARLWGETITSQKWEAQFCRLSRWSSRLTLIKPMTYMNLSGRAVAQFVNFYRIPVENIVVIHDDLDMHPGRLKLVTGGGAGGHNGIRSITQHLGDNGFHRLKIGIGRPGKNGVHPDFPVDQYVLSAMSRDEVELMNERISSIEDGLKYFVSDGPARAMSLINSIK
ncbi:peptidyl-tRNA hydrolase [Desulfopila aestuarii DSM 18488]|uniref:Peptidyl-tRNA hydrolase n=2 Tax=Desulfopila aestuarii TaxID=231440 RepID=A0A1M7YCY0_9BACT|nr:peptidyl-tRNA hydrolase [Desulfopila aestuarii DSM 18488]